MDEPRVKELLERLCDTTLLQVLVAAFTVKGVTKELIMINSGLSLSAIQRALSILKAYNMIEILPGTSGMKGNPSLYRSRLMKLEISINPGACCVKFMFNSKVGSIERTFTTMELKEYQSMIETIREAVKEELGLAKSGLKKEILEELKGKRDVKKRRGGG